ncbi:MAG: hypothetical protein AAF196_13980 [Planctomycetota bacterium]
MGTRSHKPGPIATYVASVVFGIAFVTAILSNAEFDTALIRAAIASAVSAILAPLLATPLLDALERDRRALAEQNSDEGAA